MTDSTALDDLRATLVVANQVLVHHQVLDAFGHVSARHPQRPDRFLLAGRMPPYLVGEDDILEFDLAAVPVHEPDAATFIERFIHSEIYAARPDVHSIVHSHSPAMVSIGAARGTSLQAICHTCGFLSDGVPVFEIRDVAGDASDLLIRNASLAKALAAQLANAAVVLMRGHGSTVVGSNVRHAVYRAVYAETNAKVQIAAATLGDTVCLTAAEADAAELTSDVQVERAWDFWLSQARSASARN